jgi:hypothetical protein
MADVLLSSEDITVLGGPSTISVDVDFGPDGERGSLMFVSLGHPNGDGVELGQVPNIFDMCVNVAPGTDEYLSYFQYEKVGGTDTWVKKFNLVPNTHSTSRVVTFVAGQKQMNVAASKIVPASMLSTVTASNFNVQCSISGSINPVSYSLSLLPLEVETGTGDIVLPIVVNAIEYSSGTWSALTSEVTVHLFITVV